jgi:hypothetical protein
MQLNFKDRPLSWSQIYCFNNNMEEWHDRYILGKKSMTTPEMEFGKLFAKSCEERKPLAPVTLYSITEHPLKVDFGDIPLIGYLDTYEPVKAFIDHKTSNKGWTQKRANEHGQLKMYALMLYLLYKVKPEDLSIAIESVLTEKKNGIVTLAKPIIVKRFDVKVTMADILKFGNYIKYTVSKMESYAQAMS